MAVLLDWDTQLFLALNFDGGAWLDQCMWYVSKTWPWIPVYTALVWVAWKKLNPREFLIFIGCVLVALALSDRLSVELFKEMVQRLRPSREVALQGMIHHVIDENGNPYIGGMYGFVSSHASNYAAFITLFLLVIRPSKVYAALLVSWALIVMYSRIYLGVHYPGDIIGGAALGMTLAALMYIIYKRLIRSTWMSKTS